MAAPKTVNGARAVVYVNDVIVGIFDSCSYAVSIGAEPIHTLGRFSANEIAPTSYEAVSVSCSGFRVVGEGGHILPKVPKLQDLLNLEYVKLDITDRQTNEGIASIYNCVPVNYSTGYAAKTISRVQITYLGTHASDESGAQDESEGATSF